MAEIKRSDILESGIETDVREIYLAFDELVKSLENVVKVGTDANEVMKKTAVTQKENRKIAEQNAKNQKDLEQSTKKFATVQVKAAKTESLYFKEMKKANAEKAKAAKANEKLAQKEREHQEALKLVVKTEEDAIRQNKALIAERRKVNSTTDEGKKQIEEMNGKINSNNELIKTNASELEGQRMNVGNYRNSLQGLLVSFKSGEIGLKQFGKQFMKLTAQMMANPIVLIIGAIVGALALLYKAFKATDSGGTELAARFEQIKAVVSVVMQRVAGLASALVNLFKGNFTEAANDFSNAISGTGEQMKNATKAAYDYINAIDKLEDAEDSYISQKAKNENAIAKLESIAQDQRLAVETRRAAAESAIKIGEEQMKKETDFAKTRYEEEIKYAAAKYNVSADLLKKFVEADDVEGKKLLENNKQLQMARNNLGNEGQKKLEELYSKNLELETRFFEENKRNISKLSGFEKQLTEERKQRTEDYKKKKEEELAIVNEIEEAKIQNMAEGTDKELALAEFTFNQKVAGYKKDVENVKLRNQLIEQAEIAYQNQVAAINEEAAKKADEQRKKDVEDAKKAEEEKLKAFEDSITKRTALLQSQANERMTSLNNQLASGLISESDYNNQVAALSDTLLQRQIDNITTLLAFQTLTDEERKSAEEKLVELQLALSEKAKDKEIENIQKVQKKREEALNYAGEMAGNLFSFQKSLYDRELSTIESKNKAGILSDKEAAVETAKIARKQAIADKAQALFNIALNTAQAILKVTAQTGTAAPFVIPGIIALGAVQAATVIAQPLPEIPAFDKGTQSTPDTYIAGEKRPEFRISKGILSYVSEPTLFSGSKGDTIIGGAESAAIMRSLQINPNHTKTDDLVTWTELRNIRQAIEKSKTSVNIDRKGVTTIYEGSRLRTTRIDKYFS